MGPGFKYHVATIAAVFFALTIGLMVGSLYIAPQVTDRYTRAIDRLQNTVTNSVEPQRRAIERHERFAQAVTPSLIRGKLAGLTVTLVQTGDYPDAAEAARAALTEAGARVVAVATLGRELDRPPEVLDAALTDLHAENPLISNGREGLFAALAAALTLRAPTSGERTAALLRADFLRFTEEEPQAPPARAVVLVAGTRSDASERAARVDAPLAAALRALSVRVAACEPQAAQTSDVPAYQTLGIEAATVDNIDTDPGRCALVFALRSGERGHYGVKPTAAQILPPLK